MPAYHKYVFDSSRRALVGKFEEMYQAEDSEGFDSWYERDLRELRKTISLTILNAYSFGRILELGCGKGSFTQFLKKKNNEVVALDSSHTAIEKARQSFPDIDFRFGDVSEVARMSEAGERFDLVLIMCSFAYIESWREVIKMAADLSRWLYVAEYVPPDPIGFVKSPEQLIAEVEKYFVVRSKVLLNDEHCLLLAETLDAA